MFDNMLPMWIQASNERVIIKWIKVPKILIMKALAIGAHDFAMSMKFTVDRFIAKQTNGLEIFEDYL